MTAKRLIAFSLVLVLVLSLCATAFAAYPSIKIDSKSKNLKVRRGKTIAWTFKIKSNSYSAKYGYYNAKVASFAVKGSKYGELYAGAEKQFTGNKTWKVKWKVPKSTPKGKFVNLYGAYYWSNGWYVVPGSAKTTKFNVK